MFKLNMVMRYAHPQEEHQANAVRQMETINAARQIAEFEKSKRSTSRTASTISATVTGNPQIFDGSENEGKPNRVN